MTTPVLQEKTASFVAGCEVWHELGDKVSNARHLIMNTLVKSLALQNYSSQVNQYAVIYMCLLPASKFHVPESGKYSSRQKILYQTFNLDYHEILQASETEVLAIMAQKYLDGIPKIKTFWGMKSTPFDTEKFYQDVQHVFEKEGFYSATPLTKF